MSGFNGSGTYVRYMNWQQDAANGINISASRMDTDSDGFATGLSNCLTRDGQSPALANIPMGGFKITGLANGTASTDAAAYGQLASYLALAGGTLTGKLVTVATAAGTAGFNVPAGTAPTTPVAGDFWNVSGTLFYYTGSVTRQVATLDGTETFTNKTLNSPTLKNPAATAQTLTDAATITWDANAGEVASVTLGGNRTLALPTNLKVGTYILKVTQDATGSRTLAYAAGYKWPAGSAPTLTTTANAVDILTFFSDGTSMFGAAQKAFA